MEGRNGRPHMTCCMVFQLMGFRNEEKIVPIQIKIKYKNNQISYSVSKAFGFQSGSGRQLKYFQKLPQSFSSMALMCYLI